MTAVEAASEKGVSDHSQSFEIAFSIDSRLTHVRLLSGALRGVAQDVGISSESMSQLDLIMVEAVNNVIEHAYQMEAGHEVWVRLVHRSDQSELIVSDRGRTMPENVHKGNHEIQDPFALPEGGWGLSLIQAMADSFHYVTDEQGNHLHIIKK